MCDPDFEWTLEGGSCGRCTGMAGGGYDNPPGQLHPNCRCTARITDCNDRIESTDIDVSFQGSTVFIYHTATICCWNGTEKEIYRVYGFEIGDYMVNEQEISLDMYADFLEAGMDHAGFCPPCTSENIT